MKWVVINDFTTGSTIQCSWSFEHAKCITIYVAPRKHFFVFLKLVHLRISRNLYRNVLCTGYSHKVQHGRCHIKYPCFEGKPFQNRDFMKKYIQFMAFQHKWRGNMSSRFSRIILKTCFHGTSWIMISSEVSNLQSLTGLLPVMKGLKDPLCIVMCAAFIINSIDLKIKYTLKWPRMNYSEECGVINLDVLKSVKYTKHAYLKPYTRTRTHKHTLREEMRYNKIQRNFWCLTFIGGRGKNIRRVKV